MIVNILYIISFIFRNVERTNIIQRNNIHLKIIYIYNASSSPTYSPAERALYMIADDLPQKLHVVPNFL